ncbi:hypothetical protein NX059_002534 [Plenodomus lindquistii]|nr:hypothetical protein NX059_002534 [Plenodomus lindquistii]
MSFGFAVGDFIAVGKLIRDISDCLQSVGGAESEYQELIRVFDSLKSALHHLDRLSSTGPPSRHVESIKFTALSCQYSLQEFLQKIKNYEKSLGVWGRPNRIKRTVSKLQWTFNQQEEVERLKTYLSIHLATIDTMLIQHGLESMELANRRSQVDASRIGEQLETAQFALDDIKKNSVTQMAGLRNMQVMLANLYTYVCGDLKTSLEHFGQVVSHICVSMQHIHTIVMDIRNSSTPEIDTRMTWFQAPLRVEDALGLKFPVPSEYDYDMLDTIIRRRFKYGIGSRNVEAGNYEICRATRRSEAVTANSNILPGTSLVMVVLVSTSCTYNYTCPVSSCHSTDILPCPRGGFTCSECHAWFDRSQMTPLPLHSAAGGSGSDEPRTGELEDNGDTQMLELNTRIPSHKRKRSNEDHRVEFRNVKWFYEVEPKREDRPTNRILREMNDPDSYGNWIRLG